VFILWKKGLNWFFKSKKKTSLIFLGIQSILFQKNKRQKKKKLVVQAFFLLGQGLGLVFFVQVPSPFMVFISRFVFFF